ncbi:hypothetical protein [Ideonella livida]|uniref:Uncharacterized protein n=1 Tax=Ideonella livida TaxID=2707176 RepID=A0A7C9PFH3_9BURK|nr:hypothetical protein [Ideonella livida]NDY90369.1 hypothetical protein [Ideonella livida]
MKASSSALAAWPRAVALLGLLTATGLITAADEPRPDTAFVHRPAVLQVHTEVLNPGLEAFTVTGSNYGDTLKRAGKGGFEPVSWRHRFTAAADAADRVEVREPGGLSLDGRFAADYLDGAQVRVYRVSRGRLDLVREDRVAAGGTVLGSPEGGHLRLAGNGAALRQGDMVIVTQDFAPLRPRHMGPRLRSDPVQARRWLPAGVPHDLLMDDQHWRLVPHAPDSPVEDGGQTYLALTLGPGEVRKVGLHDLPDLSTTAQSYYQVAEPVDYEAEVWVKADRADAPPLVLGFDGDPRVGGFMSPQTLAVGTTWRRHVLRLRGQPAHAGFHAYLVLSASGLPPGSASEGSVTYGIDNFRIHRADTPYLALSPRRQAQLAASGMAAWRTHHTIKTGQASYSMAQWLGPQGGVEGVGLGMSLGGTLAMMAQAGVRPWLQIEFHLSPQEWLAWAEFMAAPWDPAVDTPQSKPWAWQRVRQGRTAPWTDAFDRLYLELGNETWNPLFAPWTFPAMTDAATGERLNPGAVYGLFHDHVVDVLRRSPWWTPAVAGKFVQVLGGWPVHQFNDGIALASRSADFLTVATYLGGWDMGEGPPQPNPEGYFGVLQFAAQQARPTARALLEQAQGWQARTGRRLRLGAYEGGPGYAMNGLNGEQVSPAQAAGQEAVMKSKATGVATLDTFLVQASLGFELQNFFTFGEGERWTSHGPWHAGGHAHPSFLYLSLFNREGRGDLLRVSTVSTPTAHLPALRRRPALRDAPLVTAYATRQGDRVNVFVVSRRMPDHPAGSGEGYTPVRLELPFGQARRITLHRLSGRPQDTNLGAERVRLQAMTLPAQALGRDGRFTLGPDTGLDARGLPPAEALLYVFEGTDIGPPGWVLDRAQVLERLAR